MTDTRMRLFAALETLHALQHAESSAQSLSFSQIFDCVTLPSHASANDMKLINASLQYRRVYRYLIEKFTMYYSPKLAAAGDSEKVFERKTKEMSIDVRPLSKSDIEILIKLHQHAELQREQVNLHCFQDNLIIPLSLEKCAQNEYVSKISIHDALYVAITDINTEIFLS